MTVTKGEIRLKAIIEILTELGGKAYYHQIYEVFQERGLNDNPSWKEQIRRAIQKRSSDSLTFVGKEDLFYAVEGIGKGYWGLRNCYFKSYSWEILSPFIALKTIDKSVILYHGTVIPRNIRFFFNADELDNKKIYMSLKYNGKDYEAHIIFDDHHRSKLFWRADLSELINNEFYRSGIMIDLLNDLDNAIIPKLRFEKTLGGISLDVIIPSNIVKDIAHELKEVQTDKKEGKVSYHSTKKYERNPLNRQKAIEYHGYTCKICGFNFRQCYGEAGKGFIEIHHVNPLFLNNGEQEINPITDLIPVCSNCHSIIHRSRNEIVSVSAMKKLIGRNNE